MENLVRTVTIGLPSSTVAVRTVAVDSPSEEHEDERKKLRSRLRKKDIKFRSLSDLLSEPEATQAVWEFIRKSGKFSLWIKRAQRVLDRRKEERKKRAESRGEEQEEREEWED
ncbi:hypothetical protein BT69DRAFT_1276128 [Atractiella rhizophila]|nr:hypothetical protein BT69DRAFT_1276128 [Atractiella rhizophila]